MRGLSLERPPRWGIVTLAILFLVNLALFSFVLLRPTSSSQGGQQAAAAVQTDRPTDTVSAASTGAAVRTSDAQVPETPPVLAVYGDGYTAGNDQGGVGDAGWPAQVAASTGTTLALAAVAQAGYASVGVSGQDFLGLVQSSPAPEATVTLVVGSRNDTGEDVTAVADNVISTVDAIREAAPDTVIVLIGPIWDDGDVPADVLEIRDAVRTSATTAGVAFVDPLADGWFAEVDGLISPDGISPNDAGQAYLAGLITPVVQRNLASAGG